MADAKINTWGQNIGLSALIHAFIVFLGMSVIGFAAVVPSETMTIVLDGQAFFTPRESCNAESSEPKKAVAQEQPRRTLLQRQPVSAQATGLQQNTVADKKDDVPKIQTNDASEVVIAANENVSAQSFDKSDIQPARAASAATGPASNTPTFAGAALRSTGEQAGAAYMKEHFNFIRELIMKNLAYPHMARKMGWKGAMSVSFTICEGGRVENIRIVKSSGYKILDENVVNTIKNIQPFPRPPARAEIVIPIEYRFG